MISLCILFTIGWILHIGKIYYPERITKHWVDFLEEHAFEFSGAYIFGLGLLYAQFLDGAATNLTAFMTGYMLNSIWQGIKNNHFGNLGQ